MSEVGGDLIAGGKPYPGMAGDVLQRLIQVLGAERLAAGKGVLEEERDRMTQRIQFLARNRDAIASYLDVARTTGLPGRTTASEPQTTAIYRRITAASGTKPCGGAGQRPNDAIGGMHDEFAIGVRPRPAEFTATGRLNRTAKSRTGSQRSALPSDQ